MRTNRFALPMLAPGQAFPPVDEAWGADSPACGLLAMGGRLDVATLLAAYGNAIFPWYSEGQPILWWSTDPRMTLDVTRFRLHRSLKQALRRFRSASDCEIRVDTAFAQTIEACASHKRGSDGGGGDDDGDAGTWIVPEMVAAYTALHRAGYAHSVETWQGGKLVGGLYCVAIGRAVFGESMFSNQTDASKIALAALVCFCRANQIGLIDCQQNTGHLASMGASEMPRARFQQHVADQKGLPAPQWQFDNLYWNQLLPGPAL